MESMRDLQRATELKSALVKITVANEKGTTCITAISQKMRLYKDRGIRQCSSLLLLPLQLLGPLRNRSVGSRIFRIHSA